MGLETQAHRSWDDFLTGYAQNPYFFTPDDYYKRLYGVSSPRKVMGKLQGQYMAPLASQYQLSRENILNSYNRNNLGFGAQQRAVAQMGRESALTGAQAGGQMRQAASSEMLAQRNADLQAKMNQLQTVYQGYGAKTGVDMQRAAMQNQQAAQEAGMWGNIGQGVTSLAGMALAPMTGGMSMMAAPMMGGLFGGSTPNPAAQGYGSGGTGMPWGYDPYTGQQFQPYNEIY